MEKDTKDFKAYPVRAIRASDKVWLKFKERKHRSGLSWNLFIVELLQNGNK